MLVQWLSKKNRVICLSVLIAVALPTSNVFAYEQNQQLLYGAAAQDTTNNPDRVCVFDLDETLVKDGGYSKGDVLSGAKAAVAKCVAAGYGIAFATAKTSSFSSSRNVPYLFEKELGQTYYDKVAKNPVNGNYKGVEQPTNNPLYLSSTTVSGTKGDAMNRLMRTNYGYMAKVKQGDFTDANNQYVQMKGKAKLGVEELRGLSGCLVLFDDKKVNIDAVKAFKDNDGNRMNFQAVQVGIHGTRGVTVADVQEGFDRMNGKDGKPGSCQK